MDINKNMMTIIVISNTSVMRVLGFVALPGELDHDYIINRKSFN